MDEVDADTSKHWHILNQRDADTTNQNGSPGKVLSSWQPSQTQKPRLRPGLREYIGVSIRAST